MFCTHCGKPLIPSRKFCGSCGGGVDEEQHPTPKIHTKPHKRSTHTVSIPKRLLVSVGITALFAMLLLIAMLCAWQVELLWLSRVYYVGSLDFATMRVFQAAQGHLTIGRTLARLIPNVIASAFIAWWFATGVISDCKHRVSLRSIAGRLVTLIACIISVSVFLMLVQYRDDYGVWVIDILDTMYLIKMGVVCIVIAPFVYKVRNAFAVGKSTKTLVILMFAMAFTLDIVISSLGFGRDFNLILAVVNSLARITAHIVAGGLTVLLSLVCVAIVRGMKSTP